MPLKKDHRSINTVTPTPCIANTNLRHHTLKRFHDPGAFGFLVVGETSGDDDDSCQYDTQVQLCVQMNSTIS